MPGDGACPIGPPRTARGHEYRGRSNIPRLLGLAGRACRLPAFSQLPYGSGQASARVPPRPFPREAKPSKTAFRIPSGYQTTSMPSAFPAARKYVLDSSPHAWGLRFGLGFSVVGVRSIPTCVGFTNGIHSSDSLHRALLSHAAFCLEQKVLLRCVSPMPAVQNRAACSPRHAAR